MHLHIEDTITLPLKNKYLHSYIIYHRRIYLSNYQFYKHISALNWMIFQNIFQLGTVLILNYFLIKLLN